jgi:spermidine synthase
MEDYTEYVKEHQVTYTWHGTRPLFRQTTQRGTVLEIIERPVWGLSCFMNGSVQSCEIDEKVYHEALVDPILQGLDVRRVAVFGGGEGATVREVLKRNSVTCVDMIDWDEEVVRTFQIRFPQWSLANKAGETVSRWEDPRLHLHFEDAFERVQRVPDELYDAVIIDMFDVDESMVHPCVLFLEQAGKWTRKRIGMYVTTHTPFVQEEDPVLVKLGNVLKNMGFKTRILSTYIPSFHGYSVFLLGESESE